MTDPHVITFARCRVEVWAPTNLRTVFDTGMWVDAAPNDDPEYVAKAALWGHTSAWQMCLWHEVAHSFVAARLGYDYSSALFAEAHQIARPRGFHTREEDLVIAFCRHAVKGTPWPIWMTFPLRQVLQGGVAQFVDLVGGLE
jgi:hypothetical protein